MTKDELVKILKVMADKTRLNVLANVYTNPNISGKELLVMQKISQPTLSFHLSRLEDINIIKVQKIGQSHHYSVNKQIVHAFMKQMNEWVNSKKDKKDKK